MIFSLIVFTMLQDKTAMEQQLAELRSAAEASTGQQGGLEERLQELKNTNEDESNLRIKLEKELTGVKVSVVIV